MIARHRFVVALSAGVLLLAAPAAALSQPAAAAHTAPSANPEAEALVRRYLAAVHTERNIDTLEAAMLPVMVEQFGREHPNVSAEQRQMIVEVVRKVMREKGTPKLIEAMIPIYASTFTIEELRALVEFYESPVGRSVTDKMPTLAPKAAEATRAILPEVVRAGVLEALARLCPGGRCEAAKPIKPTAS
jgi:hypothetical protein